MRIVPLDIIILLRPHTLHSTSLLCVYAEKHRCADHALQYPEEDSAYLADMDGNFAQYFFGPDVIVAPVVREAESSNNMAPLTTWVPPGCWFDTLTGSIRSASGANVNLTKSYDLTEIPMLVRCGAVLPTIPLLPGHSIGNARKDYTALMFEISPGATSGAVDLYEDDGLSLDYVSASDSSATTRVEYSLSGTTLTIEVATIGTYSGLPAKRDY